jgi:hypothetical protein
VANHASHAALPYPIKNARYTVLVPLLDADGDPTAQTTPDTEVSEDNAAATDAAEEVSATSGMDGMGMITFTGAETDCSILGVNFKCASGPKATLMILDPRVLAEVGTGTLSAGSAGGGTLGTLLAYDVTGCFIKTTGGTGGGGTGGANNQARKIVTYNTSSGAFTVAPNWETTPSTDTTYAVLLPEGVTLGMLKALNPTTAGRTLDVSSGGEAGVDWANVGSPTTTVSLTNTTVATVTTTTTATNLTNLPTIPANWLTAAGTAADFGTEIGTAVWATAARTLTGNGGLTYDANLTQVDGDTAAVEGLLGIGTEYQANSWIRVNPTHINGTSIAGTGTRVADSFVALLNVAAPVFTVASVNQTGDSFARIGAAGASLSAVPWNASWDAEVQSEVQDALEVNNLDHLVKIAVDTDFATTVHTNSVIGHLADDGSGFDRTTDSLEIIRDLTNSLTSPISLIQTAVNTNTTEVAKIPKSDGSSSWNATALAAINTQADLALSDYDPPTHAELTAAFTTALTEGYRATGATGSVRDLLYEILGNLVEFANAGTTRTVKKLDGSTTAKTYTYDDATTPTSITEST